MSEDTLQNALATLKARIERYKDMIQASITGFETVMKNMENEPEGQSDLASALTRMKLSGMKKAHDYWKKTLVDLFELE